MAARLLQHSFEVIGYDIRAEQLEALRPQGLRAAGSIAEAAANTDAVFTVLPTLESVEEVVCGPGGLVETASRRTVIIQMSTISPGLTRRLHTAATEAGAGAEDLAVVITQFKRLAGLRLCTSRGDCKPSQMPRRRSPSEPPRPLWELGEQHGV